MWQGFFHLSLETLYALQQKDSILTRMENLEQLNWLYDQVRIVVLDTNKIEGIDTKADYEKFIKRSKLSPSDS